MIRSKLHKLLGALDDQQDDDMQGQVPGLARLLDDLRVDPLYVFDEPVARLLVESDAARASLSALAEAGMAHLPYPKMTVQYDNPNGDFTFVTSLRETGSRFTARALWLHKDGGLGGATAAIDLQPGVHKVEVNGAREEAKVCAVSLTLAVLMTHLGGLEREVLDAPGALNKTRSRLGKEPIRGCTYVHVAHVYDRDGNRVAVDGGGASGRHMPIHMRAGHVRKQAHGPGRLERKTVWIPPVLVNYRDEGLDKPVSEKRFKL